MRFLLKILFAPILAVLAVVTWFLVFVVGLSSGILCIPAAILGFFGLFITLCGFRQLRRGAAGDRVPHQPLRTAHAGDVAVSKAPRPALYASGLDILERLFLCKKHASSKSAGHIAPRFSFYSIS